MRMMLAVLALVALVQAMQPPRCEVGTATMHAAWYEVLRSHPERFDGKTDGFVALTDCDRIGDRVWVKIGSGQWRLGTVADCRNPADTPVVADWIVDADARWYAADQLPVMPLPAVVCDAR